MTAILYSIIMNLVIILLIILLIRKLIINMIKTSGKILLLRTLNILLIQPLLKIIV